MSSGYRQVGNYGHILGHNFTCHPDAALKTLIDTWDAADTVIEEGQKKVRWTFAADWEVTDVAVDEFPDGEILAVEKDNHNDWILTCRMWSYSDQAGVKRAISVGALWLYTYGTIDLQDPFIGYGTASEQVKAGTSGDPGACVATDDPSAGYDYFLI